MCEYPFDDPMREKLFEDLKMIDAIRKKLQNPNVPLQKKESLQYQLQRLNTQMLERLRMLD